MPLLVVLQYWYNPKTDASSWEEPTGPGAAEWKPIAFSENEREPAATRQLRRFILEKSAESYRFAMLLYW